MSLSVTLGLCQLSLEGARWLFPLGLVQMFTYMAVVQAASYSQDTSAWLPCMGLLCL